jgi:hypothetical protein
MRCSNIGPQTWFRSNIFHVQSIYNGIYVDHPCPSICREQNEQHPKAAERDRDYDEILPKMYNEIVTNLKIS